jgi:hypothetical protein
MSQRTPNPRRMSSGLHAANKPSPFKKKVDVLKEAAQRTPGMAGTILGTLAPVIAIVVVMAEYAAPYAIMLYAFLNAAWRWADAHGGQPIKILVGLFMCFCGSAFPATITAVEAYRQIGFEPTKRALKVLLDDFKNVQEANKKDEQKDSSLDGVSDVQALTAGELAERKVLLFLRTSDPEATSSALSAITSGYLAVLASLKIKFAQAIVVGGAIGDVLRPPVRRALEPALKKALPEDYHKWIRPFCNYGCKLVAVSVAWTLQRIITSFHSAVRGGQIAGDALVVMLKHAGVLKHGPHESVADEAVGYLLAFFGLAYQIKHGFALPFPVSVLLLPFSMVEMGLRWCVNSDL